MRTPRIAVGLIVAVTLARTFAHAPAPATPSVPPAMIITLAYPPIGTADMVGLPDWASREYYEVSATASLANPTPEDRSAMIHAMLRRPAGRLVVNKTGLTGWYRVTLTYDVSANQDLARSEPPSDALSVFTAVREQLGLKLEPSRTERDVLVIDRLERPTEN